MPRKRGPRRGNPSTLSKGNKNGLESSFVPFSGTGLQKNHNGLTLQQEAVNTGRNSSFWNTDQRLRDTKVSFISAGNLDNKESTDEADEADKADEADGSDSNNTALAEMSLRSKPQARNEEGDHDLAATIANTPSVDMNVTESFVIDTLGSKPVATGLPPPQLRAVSPTPSNSSEEIILFRGKGRPPRVAPEKSRDDKREKVKVSGIDNQMRVIDDEIHQREELLEHVQHQSSSFRTPVSNAEANGVDNQMRIIDDEIQQREELLEHVEDQSSTSRTPSRNARQSSPEAIIVVEEEVPLQDHFERGSHRNTSQLSRKRNRLSKREREEDRRRRKEREDDAMIADYVANMAQEEPEDETFDQNPFVDQFRVRELGWGEAQGTRDTPEQSLFEHITDTQGESGWNTEDIQDFNGISTSDGEVEETDRILSKRERKCGVQYLVIYSGQIIDDARWVKSAKLSSSNQLRMIAEFEAEEKLLEDVIREHERMAESSNSSDEDLDDDMEDDSDDGDHEELLLQKAMEQMSDEQMARLLAKQEELGMGSNELLLFDAEMDEDEEDDMYFETSAFSRSAKRGPVMMGSKKPGAKRPRGEFPPATALADAYDGFDVMDFERPSLKKKPKGRKGKLPIDISDSELEASMEIAYENDRVKKRERKQEREELRAQGLLGGKNGKVDLKSKYKEGMGIEAVKGAIKIFLMNGRDTTLPLTPMDKGDRKMVHEYAQAFNLKSKSVGSGNKRFPVLYRTKNTSIFTESKFTAVEARLSRRFMKRPDAGGKKYGGSSRPTRGGGGFGNSAAGYRDGDVVGASAPELGAENRGRAMLEKMGWSTGTALGALNNKGILQPVSHVVKTTKAGLG